MLSINQFVIDPSEMSVPDSVGARRTPAPSHSAQITSVYQCLSASVTCATQRGSPEVHHAAHKHMLRHRSQLILLTGCCTKALMRSDQIKKKKKKNDAHPEAGVKTRWASAEMQLVSRRAACVGRNVKDGGCTWTLICAERLNFSSHTSCVC